ncbi:hypothetical protein FDC58_15595 [Clostridium botulinum]|nr:hypothetical protein [Clostridium botulinum]NFP30620.1 hypothetical protein [Clostridium botulinum]
MSGIDFTKFFVIESYNKYDWGFDIDYVSKNSDSIDYKEYYKQVKKEFNKYKNNPEDITNVEKVRLVTDIKRIIDCRCRVILNKLGYVKKITKKNYPELKEISELKNLNDLTLISFLLDIDLEIIFKSRQIRNCTEHEHTVPTFDEIKESLSSCELFLIVLKNMFDKSRLSYFEIYSEDADYKITIQPYKSNYDVYENIGGIALDGIYYHSFKYEYSILLRYILARNFDNIPRELFKINSDMPNDKINCIGLTFGGEHDYDNLFFDSPFDFI